MIVTRQFLAIALIGLLSAACSPMISRSAPVGPASPMPGAGRSDLNGQEIYFAATDQYKNRISYEGGPASGGMMMGSDATCAACHGADGHGGVRYFGMQVVDAPSIYYGALAKMKQEDFGGTSEPAYTLDDFRREVVTGRDLDGSPLNPMMPRWEMDDADLADLFHFLKVLH